jgi:hypothetical protein
MTINTALLVAAPMLQDYFVDKDSGAPLSGGVVTCYKDDARTTFKNWFKQTGTPDLYTYVALPNPLTLSAVGTIQDGSGNDVIPFFYPFDEGNQNNAEPYYITVVSSGAVPQFTRENFPFVPNNSSSDTDQNLINYIPNGQFLAHNNLPPVGTTTNQVQNGLQQVAVATQGTAVLGSNTSVIVGQGGSIGWYFIKRNASTDTDKISFTQISQEPQTLTGNPRYAINLSCTSSSGNDTYKELRMRFNNVNRFSSATQQYTFGIAGKNINTGSENIELKIIKYFGSGGSPSAPVETQIQEFTLVQDVYSPFSATFVFGSNTSYSLGTNNDDYIEIVISLPSTSIYTIELTDVILTPGNIQIDTYPEQVDNQVFADAIAGSLPTPDPNGNDLYLPMILTRSGATFDRSVIGKISADPSLAADPGYLLADGSQYLRTGYSTEGIPYARLQAKYAANGNSGVPQFGTGRNFVTAHIAQGATNGLYVVSNLAGTGGTVSVPTDHGTGFTFTPINAAASVNYGALAYRTTGTSFLIRNDEIGAVTAATAATSGFTVSTPVNNAYTVSITYVSGITVASGLAGKYFTYSSPTLQYVVWFKVDGSGSAPSVPGATLIEIDLLSTDTAGDTTNKIVCALQGGYGSVVATTTGSAITQSSYFSFGTVTNSYYVWYKKNNSTDPVPSGIGIEVDILDSDTAAIVATKTKAAINNMYLSVPDYRGFGLRGHDPDNNWDFDDHFGYMTSNIYGPLIGAYQLDSIQAFNLQQIGQVHGTVELNYGPGSEALATIGTGNETRGVSASVNWFIKY